VLRRNNGPTRKTIEVEEEDSEESMEESDDDYN